MSPRWRSWGATGNKVDCLLLSLCHLLCPHGPASAVPEAILMMHVHHECRVQGLTLVMSNPVLANGLSGLAASATAQATVEVRSFC